METQAMSTINDQYLTISQTRSYLKCSEGFLWKLRKEGKIKSVKFPLKVLIVRASVDEYLKTLEEVAA